MQLFHLLEADQNHCISPDELYMAITSLLALRKPSPARQKWQRHKGLLPKWAPSQQEDAFQAALSLLQRKPSAAALAMAERACLLGAEHKVPNTSQQVHDLVLAMLSRRDHQAAYKVSNLLLYDIKHLFTMSPAKRI